ncbi:spore coat polysaccharide biosynthesis protein SpsC, partial [gut metagenome]
MNMQLRNVPFSPPDMTEAEANEVRDAILSGWITTGPRTKEFEKQIAAYVGVDKAVALNSQTACAEMALRLLGIGEGDEVIVPAYTYTASASIVNHVGAKIVFVDVQDNCLEMDYTAVENAINERTKAIIPVDLAGIPCDYDRLFQIVEAKKALFQPKTDLQKMIGRVAICCDAAHAFGAERKGVMVGAIADFSSFSFHAVKNLTTAEGGALTWNLPFGNEIAVKDLDNNQDTPLSGVPVIEGETWNQKLYRITQLLSLHGQNKDALAKTKLGAWEYDIVGPWFKCNMTDVVAAIGLIQMKRYPGMLEQRKQMIERYDEALKSLNVAVLNHYGAEHRSSGHLYLVRLLGKTREETN